MSSTADRTARVIRIGSDKPNRAVVVETVGQAGASPITLEVGGIAGQSEWTWLSVEEARDIAHALLRAVVEAPQEAPTVRANDHLTTREDFEAYLLDVCRRGPDEVMAASYDDGAGEDARAVWHAAEVALGILGDGYLPKFEAMSDMLALAAKVYGDEHPGLNLALNSVVALHDEKLASARAVVAEADEQTD